MKKIIILIVCLAMSFKSFGQVTITYSYDSAGNRTTRNMSEINLAMFLTYESGIKKYDNCSLKRESGIFCYTIETSIFHNPVALEKQTIGDGNKSYERNNMEVLVNDFWLDARRKLNVRDGNNEIEPTL